MHKADAFSKQVGEIYDAALDPSLWHRVLKRVAALAGADAAWLTTRASAGGPGSLFIGFGGQPKYRRLYFETYFRLDPIEAVLPRLALGQVVSNSSVTPTEEFMRTRFYTEWMKPQGWLDRALVLLDRSPSQNILLAISRSERDGWVDEGVYQRMRLIAPHLRRSILICLAAGLQTSEASTLAATLDGLSAGVLLIDGDGCIVHMNASGADMLGEGIMPDGIAGTFSAHAPETTQALFQRLAQTAQGPCGLGGQRPAVPVKSPKGDRYVAHLLQIPPLTSGVRRQSRHHGAVAAVFIQKAAPTGPDLAAVIARHCKLTPTETRVLLTIINAGSIQQAANALGITKTTVKTHLRRLYSKTQTNGQLELVKLVAGFSSLFRPD